MRSIKFKKTIIYHHNDHDGIVAAGIVYNYIKNSPNFDIPLEDIKTVMIDYGTKLDLRDLDKRTLVWFLDYSFTNKTNIMAVTNAIMTFGHNNFIWIDHHLSSINVERTTILGRMKGIRYVGYCGAYLSYFYTHEIFERRIVDVDYVLSQPGSILDKYYKSDNIPPFLKYVDDYDCWKKQYPDTNAFHYGFSIIDPSDITLEYLLENKKETVILNSIIERGKQVKSCLDFENKNYHVDMYGFEVWMDGYKCFALNRKGNSLMFGDLVDKYDIVIPFYYDGYLWRYSLFTTSNNVDCEEIAKKHGGGGHAKAAGFQTRDLIFRNGKVVEPK